MTDRSRHGLRYTSEDLLDAATEEFAWHGYKASSMDSVAARAGSTKPTLYKHFGSKDDLYAACLAREIDRLQDLLFAAYERATHLPTMAQVQNSYAAFFDYADAHPHGFRLVFAREQPDFAVERVEAFTAAVIERQMRYVVREFPVGTYDDAEIRLLVGMLVGLGVSGARELVAGGVAAARATEFASAIAWAGFPSLRPLSTDNTTTDTK